MGERPGLPRLQIPPPGGPDDMEPLPSPQTTRGLLVTTREHPQGQPSAESKNKTSPSFSKQAVQAQATQMMRQGYQGAQDFGRQYAVVFTEVARRSPFELWPREAMIDLLVMQNIELRHEDEIVHFQLVNICNQVFATQAPPPMPVPMSPQERAKAEGAALMIQRLWIQKNKARKADRALQSQSINRALLTNGVIAPPGARDSNRVAQCPTPNSAWKELEQEWMRPDVDSAKEYAEYNHPRMGGPGGSLFPLVTTTAGRYCMLGGCGEQLDLWDEGAVSELALFGSGITNYFKFTKWCAWTMLMLFVIYVPQIVINTFGASAFSFSSYTDVAKTTLGNLVTSLNGTSNVMVPYCENFSTYFHVLDCDLNKTSLALLYTYVDVCGCLFLFLSWMWLKRYQRLEARHLDRHTVTASDYTVKIKRIPPTITEMDIRKHFAQALNLSVASVALGYNNAREIEQYQLRGDVVRKRSYVVNRYRYINTLKKKFKAGQVWYLIRELPWLKSTNDRLLSKIQHLDTKIGIKQADRKPLCAFVTFNTQEAVVQALAAYRWTLFKYLLMPKQLRLKGYRIRMERAPEPSLILWENLQYSTTDRLRRKITTTFLAGSLIVISIILAFVSRYYQEQNLSTDTTCPTGWEDLTNGEQRHTAKSDSRYLGCFCREKKLFQQINDDVCKVYLQKTSLAVFWTIFASFSVVVVNYLIQLGLEAMTKYEKHHSLDRQELEISLRVFFLKFINTGCVMLLLNSAQVQDFLHVHVSSYGNFTAQWYLTTGLSLIVVMVLNIIGPVAPSLYYYYLTRKHQKHATEGETADFMSQEEMNNVFMGPEFRVSDRYAMNLVIFFVCFIYASGMPILLLLAAISFFVGYWVDKFLFLRYYRIPPQYGQELSRGVTNTMVYALLLHLLVSIWAYSQQDIFTQAYENSQLAKWISTYSAWTDQVQEQLPRKNILPLLMVLLALVAYLILRYTFKGAARFIRALVALVTCSVNVTKDENGIGELNSIDVTYQRAVDRGLIKGLSTYNILQNPKYKQAFAISDKFAERHTHVESIRHTLGGEFDDNESDGGSENDQEPASQASRPAAGGGGGGAGSPALRMQDVTVFMMESHGVGSAPSPPPHVASVVARSPATSSPQPRTTTSTSPPRVQSPPPPPTVLDVVPSRSSPPPVELITIQAVSPEHHGTMSPGQQQQQQQQPSSSSPPPALVALTTISSPASSAPISPGGGVGLLELGGGGGSNAGGGADLV